MEHQRLELARGTLPLTNGRRTSEETVAFLLGRLVERVGTKYGRSPREKQVLEAAALGKHTKVVALDLHCGPKTIEEYWRRIYRRFRLDSRQEIVARLLWEALAGVSTGTRNDPPPVGQFPTGTARRELDTLGSPFLGPRKLA